MYNYARDKKASSDSLRDAIISFVYDVGNVACDALGDQTAWIYRPMQIDLSSAGLIFSYSREAIVHVKLDFSKVEIKVSFAPLHGFLRVFEKVKRLSTWNEHYSMDVPADVIGKYVGKCLQELTAVL